jgi:hypothetical protein
MLNTVAISNAIIRLITNDPIIAQVVVLMCLSPHWFPVRI